MQIPVYIINLKRSVERRDYIIKHLNNLSVNFQIIEAVDGSELSDQEILDDHNIRLLKQGTKTRYMVKGEIGAVLSHFKIYQKMIDEDIELACILEDDIECRENFKDFLNGGNQQIVDWDLLFLGHHSEYSKKEAWTINRKKLKFGNYRIGEPIELPGGAYGYLINREAVKKILKHGYPIRMSIDNYIGNAPALGIRTRLLSPPCVGHNYEYSSTIFQNPGVVYSKSFIESFRSQVRKIYRWLPFLQTFHVWINRKPDQCLTILRKAGLLRSSYAKFYK
jgi:glycosyl transferase, family 25